MVLYKATIKTIWIRKLFFEIRFPQTTPTNIYSDNQSVMFEDYFISFQPFIDTPSTASQISSILAIH